MPGLSDYVVMVRRARPKCSSRARPLLLAATGEVALDERSGRRRNAQRAVAGTGEFLAEDDADALRHRARCDAQHRLGTVASPKGPLRVVEPPRLRPRRTLWRRSGWTIESRSTAERSSRRVVDSSEFVEFKGEYDRQTICGTRKHCRHARRPRWQQWANHGGRAPTKAAQFIQLCCQSNLPIVYLMNTHRLHGRLGLRARRASSSTAPR